LQNIAEKKEKVINTFCSVSLFLAKNKRTTRLMSAALTHHLGKLSNVQKEVLDSSSCCSSLLQAMTKQSPEQNKLELRKT
jgi:hypothetical protein